MSVKKLSFYIDTAKVTVKSDHLPLKKFLEKNTLNSKVNNWAVELESQDITFEYIPGIQNTLADTLSRLIEMDKNIKLHPEEEGKEFGYFPFEELPPVTTQVLEEVIECEIGNINIQHTDPIEINTDIHLPLKDDKLAKLQESDPHMRQLRKQCENKNLDKNTYTMENNILMRKLVDNGLLYTPIVVPDILRDCLLILAHDKQGHNGFRRTYALLKNRYHWKGMKKSIYQHGTNCQVCAKHNIKTQQLKNEHFSSPPQPREGRKVVPNSKMPNLAWDIAETQLTQEAQKENNSNITQLLQTLITVVILIIAIVKQITTQITGITKKTTQVIENVTKRASNNKIIKNIKDFHRTLTAAITLTANATNRTNHRKQAQINNKTTRYSPGMRKLNDEYDESYQSLTSRTYSYCNN